MVASVEGATEKVILEISQKPLESIWVSEHFEQTITLKNCNFTKKQTRNTLTIFRLFKNIYERLLLKHLATYQVFTTKAIHCISKKCYNIQTSDIFETLPNICDGTFLRK